MRLTIRRKLMGTLVIVGLLPLTLSLLVILGLGTRMRLKTIHRTYHDVAYSCAQAISLRLNTEVRRLNFLAHLPSVIGYAQKQNALHSRAAIYQSLRIPPPTRRATRPRTGAPARPVNIHSILHNSIASYMRLISHGKPLQAHLLMTDRYGDLIAADVKPRHFFQADQSWWRKAFRDGQPREWVSTVVKDPQTGGEAVVIVLPIRTARSHTWVGFVKETFGILPILRRLRKHIFLRQTTGQLFDRRAGRTVLLTGNITQAAAAQRRFQQEPASDRGDWLTDLFAGTIIGSAPVKFTALRHGAAIPIRLPSWSVIISQPTFLALQPIFRQGRMIGIAGVLMIVGLFILGYIISQREIVDPIHSLQQATAAVGRGQLNVRLLSGETVDPTFRHDELGDLAHDFERMAQRLQYSRNKLEQGNQTKKRFIDLAAHELRTPVTRIISAMGLLRRQLSRLGVLRATEAGAAENSDPTANIRLHLDVISTAAARLEKIINDLCKLVETDRFSTQLHRRRFDIRELIRNVCEENRGFLAVRRQQLELDIPETLPSFDGDPDKISDILTNVLSNASRFSPDGATIKVAVRMVIGGMLEIIVQDFGSGISPQVMEELFEPFHTGDEILRHHSGDVQQGGSGLGLGLAIVRRFVDMHDGALRVDPSPQGTRVQILLPLSEEAPLPPGAKDPAAGAAKTPSPQNFSHNHGGS